MKNPRYRRHSQPPQQPPRSEKSLKETVMGAAFSLWCILGDWVHLIRLYFNFEIWCREYRKTYPSVKEKLYRFSVFRKTFEMKASMPNGFGDRTQDELEYLLPLRYEDSDSENEFHESLRKRAGNTYRICEENNQVLVYCYGPNTFRDSEIKEKILFERLRKDPDSTYQVLCEGNDIFTVRCLANRCVPVPVPDQTPNEIVAFES